MNQYWISCWMIMISLTKFVASMHNRQLKSCATNFRMHQLILVTGSLYKSRRTKPSTNFPDLAAFSTLDLKCAGIGQDQTHHTVPALASKFLFLTHNCIVSLIIYFACGEQESG